MKEFLMLKEQDQQYIEQELERDQAQLKEDYDELYEKME